MKGPRPRWPRGGGEWLAAALVAVALLTALVELAAAAAELLVRSWPVSLAAALGGSLCGGWRAWRGARAERERAAALATLRIRLDDLDAMGDKAFEFALRDLLIRDGWAARVVGRKGDQAADVIADQERRGRIVLQAKHTRVGNKVRSSVMYQVKGTAGPVHGADTAVVVTNADLTRDAKAWGDRHQVHWLDRERLRHWAELGTPLHAVLRLPEGRSRRRTARREVPLSDASP
ncbi:restriction endonuclease [Streptomyces sp. 3MP-14]|uniref:Restriction endonuclease n=1 Tax=Streptomyces mimosae TaxID=2586635 RepID=A0A5N6A2G7_9ACTN|nr:MULTISPECIES: restriction endonuclease [Streptomyces]KAB8162891.1 restriction endonuclease [Streptomyces mimosae]KAB8179104.1 restriction endonuclease [Streptomyces sp. 3MP-14]